MFRTCWAICSAPVGLFRIPYLWMSFLFVIYLWVSAHFILESLLNLRLETPVALHASASQPALTERRTNAGVPGPMGPKKTIRRHKKSHFPENWGLSSFLGILFLWGVIFQNVFFAEGRSTRSPWCLEKIQGPIWRSKDHLVMKGLSKNVKNHEFWRFHYSVRQKIGDPGSIPTQNMFPLISVTPKPP